MRFFGFFILDKYPYEVFVDIEGKAMEQDHVTGMTCAACCASVEKAVSAVPV